MGYPIPLDITIQLLYPLDSNYVKSSIQNANWCTYFFGPETPISKLDSVKVTGTAPELTPSGDIYKVNPRPMMYSHTLFKMTPEFGFNAEPDGATLIGGTISAVLDDGISNLTEFLTT